MARYLRQNTATIVTIGPFIDILGLALEDAIAEGASELITFIADTNAGGAPTIVLDMVATNASTDNDVSDLGTSGYYGLELTAANTNYVGRAVLSITNAAVHLPVFHEFTILPANVFDSLVLGSGVDLLDVNTAQWLGTACAAVTTGGVPEVDVTYIAGAAVSATTAQLGVNLVNIAGSAVSATTAQLGVNAVQIGASATAATNLALAAALMYPGTASGTLTTTRVDSSNIDALISADFILIGAILIPTSGTQTGCRCRISNYTVSGGVATITLDSTTPLRSAMTANDTFLVV